MEIIKKEIINYNINDLKVGDLFLYGSSVYMKIEKLNDAYCSYNAISLENPCGICANFYEDEKITPLDATLTVWKRG